MRGWWVAVWQRSDEECAARWLDIRADRAARPQVYRSPAPNDHGSGRFLTAWINHITAAYNQGKVME